MNEFEFAKSMQEATLEFGNQRERQGYQFAQLDALSAYHEAGADGLRGWVNHGKKWRDQASDDADNS